MYLKEDVFNQLLQIAEKGGQDTVYFDDFDRLVPDDDKEEVESMLNGRGVYVIDGDVEDEGLTDEDISKFLKNVGCKTPGFVNDLAPYRRLTSEEEFSLLRRVQVARNADKLIKEDNNNEIEQDVMDKLQKDIEDGAKAREIIIYSYHTYVLNIVHHYIKCGAIKGTSYNVEKLFSAGMDGIVSAFNTFDCSKENRLCAWARFMVMNAIQYELATTRNPIAVPKTAQYQRGKLVKLMKQIEKETGKTPTFEEVARALGTPESRIQKKVRSMQTLFESSKPTIDLDKKVKPEGDEEGETFDRFIPDNSKNPEEVYLEKQIKKEINQLLSKILNPKEVRVLNCRFGLNENEKLTLETIGNELGLTRERVRQIEDEALKKLAKSSYRQQFVEMLATIPRH